MGLADELRKSAAMAGSAALQAAGAGAKAFNEWSVDRVNESDNSGFDEWIEKASTSAKKAGNDGHHSSSDTQTPPEREPEERKALHFDPFDLVAAMGYRERPSALTFRAMERVGRSVPVIADIIATRTNQVIMFCEEPEGRHAPGFEVRLRDKQAKVTKASEKRGKELCDMLMHCGNYDREHPEQTTSLIEFAKMFIPDSLSLDQATFEVVPDRKGDPSYFAIVDPSTIRLLDPHFRDKGDPFAVQVIDGSIVTDFDIGELAFCIRNPRSGIKSYGYGIGEIETLVREITGLLWGMDYNRRFFTQGSATRGVLNFKGTIPDKQLRAFRRQWYAMVSGVANAWRTPITNAEELQWINMQMSNRDMEYNAWIDFLIKICCARYNIAPEEVQFSYGNTGQPNSMGQPSIEEKLKQSKDLGLRPLVRWFFAMLNIHFMHRLDSDFEAVPIGLEDKGEEAETELLDKQTSVFMTIDEARELRGDEPMGEENGGHIIRDPNWIQYMLAQQQQEQMEAEQEGEEEIGPEEGEEFDFEDEMPLDEE